MTRWVVGVLRAVAVLLIVIAAALGGVGWLYALRHVQVLKVGPRLTDALPLQRLAGGAAQPLGRVVVAWLSTGIATGFALAVLTHLGRVARAAVVFVLSLVAVLAVAAVSDSLTHNEPMRHHLHEQPHRAATWVAAALMAVGALLAPAIGRDDGRHAPRAGRTAGGLM